ncbi:MAG: HEAT repeat domain-containing protein [Phycisphaerales bacterium]|nr:HEAT repeat domain-containing protein [Phycisphaerales bacterium]
MKTDHIILGVSAACLVAMAGCQHGPGSTAVAEGEREGGRAPAIEVAMETETGSGPGSVASPGDVSRYESSVVRSAMRERAINVLADAALSDVALLRAHALEGLSPAPQRAETVARAAVEDPNPGVRSVAAMVVGRLRLKSSAPLLRPLLSDPDQRVRAAAMYGMRINGLDIDMTPLARMVMERDPLVRRQAALVLGELGEPSAAGLLDESLQRVPAVDSSQDRLVRLEVANAMVKLGRRDAIHHIRAALYPQSAEGVEAAVFAALLLGELNNRDSAKQLVEIVEQDVPRTESYEKLTDPSHPYMYPPELRLAAAQGLAEMGFRDGRYVADTYRGHADAGVRSQAARLFGSIGDASSLSRLDAMLADESVYVRVAAAAAVVDAVR